MKVKTFHALTMQDALRAIKEELGPDAIILSSKEVREGGRILRVFNRPVLEVMAAAEQEIPQPARAEKTDQRSAVSVRTSGTSPSPLVPVETFQQTLRGLVKPSADQAAPGGDRQEAGRTPSRTLAKRTRMRQLRLACAELSHLLQDLSQSEPPPRGERSWPFLMTLRRSWLEQGMNASTVESLVSEGLKNTHGGGLPDEQSFIKVLRREIVQRVRISGPLLHGDERPGIGLLIGPSGAGKTSAVAKLAAHYRLEQRKSVALITFDTYRETAVEQLRRYAKIVGAPFACALSARQVQEGLRRHSQVDLVLIDMPGIGADDLVLARDLRRLLKKDTITTHLVLPASIREQEACRITRRLGDLPKLCLLFTKLDETESFGTIFQVMHSTGIPLSYWSIGRRVPGDIEVASPASLAARLTTWSAMQGREEVSHGVRSAEAMSALIGTAAQHG